MYAVEILSLFTLYYYPNSTQVQFDERPISKESRRYICTYMYVCMYVCMYLYFIFIIIYCYYSCHCSRSISEPKNSPALVCTYISGVDFL